MPPFAMKMNEKGCWLAAMLLNLAATVGMLPQSAITCSGSMCFSAP